MGNGMENGINEEGRGIRTHRPRSRRGKVPSSPTVLSGSRLDGAGFRPIRVFLDLVPGDRVNTALR